MEPIATILSNMTGGQLIMFLTLCVLVSIALHIAAWHSTRNAMRRLCEIVQREHDEHRRMLAALVRDPAPPMSDPLPPDSAEGGFH